MRSAIIEKRIKGECKKAKLIIFLVNRFDGFDALGTGPRAQGQTNHRYILRRNGLEEMCGRSPGRVTGEHQALWAGGWVGVRGIPGPQRRGTSTPATKTCRWGPRTWGTPRRGESAS